MVHVRWYDEIKCKFGHGSGREYERVEKMAVNNLNYLPILKRYDKKLETTTRTKRMINGCITRSERAYTA